ncbi:hypothetical protein T040910_206 [Synechococcus phage S-CAM3]|uniref:Uncharacterized protein n=1 Tax=Synechococcus phage S-CAM3 TaxID=1883366 RepID=A0A1D8KJW5_9CAUD|nr:hypothetical protein BOW87_gp052 [Synechococcus phage S-CAM3]AOV58950.1 hypothetical protein T040910_206 [Synechococcus phage S-CAM3]AOV59189.1 hypothetical protein C421010_206 [Synechococcus phage S-CAM3]
MSKNKNKIELKDIYQELAYLRAKIDNVSNQMQELREAIRSTPYQTEELPVRESYEHPWYKYKRQELIAGGNYTKPTREKYSATITARYAVSGAATTTQDSSN